MVSNRSAVLSIVFDPRIAFFTGRDDKDDNDNGDDTLDAGGYE